jgi:hypothetical protein
MAVDTPTDGQIAAYQASSGEFEWVANSGGGFTSFTVAGDAGANQTITDGNTLTLQGSGGVTKVTMSATDTATISLENTGVTAGNYTYASISVDAQGRLTAASSGSTPPSGSGIANQLTYWNGTSSITGSTKFTIDATAGDITATGQIQGSDYILAGGGLNEYALTSDGEPITITPSLGVNTGSISISEAANGDITITPDGTGKIKLDGLAWPNTDGTNGQVLQTDGLGTLSFATVSGGGTSPGGSDGDFQINDSGAFGGTILSTNKTTTITLNSGTSGDPQIQMTSSTKSITLKVDTNNKLKVEGGTNSFVFDASSATGGITWPDGSTQTSASTATIGGSIANTQVAYGSGTNTIQGSNNLTFDGTNLDVAGYVKSGTGVYDTDGLTDLTLQTNGGTNSGTIVIRDGVGQDIEITPNGAGSINLDGFGLKWPTADGTVNQVLATDGAGTLSFTDAGGGGGGAPTDAEYVTLATNGSLTNERVLANGQSIRVIDGGAGNNVTVQSQVFNAPRAKKAGDRWVVTKMPPYSQQSSTIGLSTSTSYDRPSFYTFIAPATGDIDELGIYIQGAAASSCNALLGVYTTSNDGWPEKLMGYATYDVTTTGGKNNSSFTYANGYTAISTNAGETYWLAFVRDTTTIAFNVSCVSTSSPQMSFVTGSSNPIFSSYGFQYTSSNNALPSLPNQTNWIGAGTEVYAHVSVSYAV